MTGRRTKSRSTSKKSPRGRRLKYWVLLLLLLLIGGCSYHLASAFLPSDEITISAQTTVFNGPLRENGHVDYVAALNQQLSERVTPQNNAAVLLSEALPTHLSGDRKTEFYRLLEVPPPASSVSEFVPETRYIEELDSAELDAFIWQRREAARGQWRRNEFPLVAAWCDQNASVLDAVTTAVQTPECYVPITGDIENERLSGYLTSLEGATREVAGLLALRSNLRLRAGDLNGAWSDLLTLHRLSRLIGNSPFLAGRLLGFAQNSMACQSGALLAHHPELTGPQARHCLEDLASLSPTPDVADAVDSGERFVILDTIQFLARQGSAAEMGTASALHVPCGHIDWDTSMRIVNELYDQLCTALRQPGFAESSSELNRTLNELRAEWSGVSDQMLSLWVTTVLGTRSAATREFTRVMLALLTPAVDQAQIAQFRSVARQRLIEITFALAAHRIEQGGYPAALDELAPEYLETVPLDPFNDEYFIYSPTEGGVYRLYSVGDNLVDDGGATFDSSPEGDDIILYEPD